MAGKIYTRNGDKGQTSLLFGTQVPKDDCRVETYGTVDELSSALGLAGSLLPENTQDIRHMFNHIQAALLHLGTLFSTPAERSVPGAEKIDLPQKAIELEQAMDALDENLPPLTGFIVPGGHPAAAATHLARTVCRRAERQAVRLTQTLPPSQHPKGMDQALTYLNRLSDYLFTAARAINHLSGVPE